MNLYIAVFIGGGAGSVARFGISKVIYDNFKNINPLGTFAANIMATITLGILIYYFHSRTPLSPPLKALLVTGFCGGFSTFSTFSYETMELLQLGEYHWAAANVVVSILVALFGLWMLRSVTGI